MRFIYRTHLLRNNLIKKLFILMPFVLFLYAPEFRSLEKDPGGIDKLRDHVSAITENLYRQYLNGELEKEDINSILDLMERILEKLLINYKSLEKGVDYIMGGELIKTRTDEAREQGLEQGKVSVLIDLVLSGDISVQKAAEKLGISKEDFEERMRVVQDK